ncbi:MAG: metallophosphoesterase [bacterium]|nr:metallophosphoesterase [bacterium]
MRKVLLVAACLIAFALAAAGSAYIDAFVLEPNWLKIERVTVVVPRLAPLLGDLTIVHLSDIHFRKEAGFLEESIARAIRRIGPDIIFMSGDLVSRRSALRAFWAWAGGLEPRIWTYAIPGDTDDALINDTWEDDGWRRAGIALLVDEVLPVVWPGTGERRIWLVAASHAFDWKAIGERVPEDEPVIVLAEKPLMAKEAALARFDLVLAGDTHGHQMGIPALARFSAYTQRGPYVAGLYGVRGTLLYVNRGTGWTARPMRFFCRPELTVFRFEAEGEMGRRRVLPGDE